MLSVVASSLRASCLMQVAVPDDMRETVASRRAELVERIAEVDETVGELFLLEEPVDNETLKAGIRRATLALKFVPVFMGRSAPQLSNCVHNSDTSICSKIREPCT